MKRITMLVATALVVATSALASGTPKFLRATEKVPDEYIVQLGATNISQFEPLLKSLNGKIFHYYKDLNAVLVKMPAQLAEMLAASPLVARVEENAILRPAPSQIGTIYPLVPGSQATLWGIDRVDQIFPSQARVDNEYSWNTTGANTRVYVFDTGIYPTHPEFCVDGSDCRVDSLTGLANYLKTYSNGADPTEEASVRFVEPQCWQKTTIDDSAVASHGTAVASIVGGETVGIAKV